MANGLAAIAKLAGGPRRIRKARAPGTAGSAPAAPQTNNQPAQVRKDQPTGKTIVPGSGSRPPTTQQLMPGGAASSTAPPAGPDYGPGKPPAPDYSSLLQFSQGYKPKNFIDNLVTSQSEKNIRKQSEQLLQSGDIAGAQALWEKNKKDWWTKDYANAMSQQFSTFQSTQGAAGAGGAGSSAVPNRATAGQPGATPEATLDKITKYPTATGQFGEAVSQAEQTGQQQAEQVAGRVGEAIDQIQTGIDETTQGAAQRIEGLSEEGQAMHDQFTQERQALSQQVLGSATRVQQNVDKQLGDFTDRVTAAQGVIDAKESAAMSQVFRGQTAAMQAAVQGIQGQVNSQVAQINSNPNLTPAQKQQMISQVRMQGAGQMAPAVGQTTLQFNQLAASTATAFGQMATQVQTAGLAGAAGIMESGIRAYTDTTQAANSIAANLLATQSNADNNYLSSMGNLENTRATLELSGEQIRASILPHQGEAVPDYLGVSLMGLEMNNALWKQDAQQLAGTYQIQTMAQIAKESGQMGWLNLLLQAAPMAAQLIL